MADDIKEPPKKGLIRGLLGRKQVPKSQEKEKRRESNAWKKKLFGYLEGFKKSFEALEKGGGEKKKGGFLSSMLGGLKGLMAKLLPAGLLAAIPAALLGMLGTLGIGALLIGGVVAIWSAIKDAFEGYMNAKAGEWGNIDGISGAIGAFFGGTGSGFWNAVVQGSKWAVMGATIGIAFGPPGILAGAIIGLALGAVAGWFGGEKIAKWVDGAVKGFRSLFDLPEAMSEEQKKLAQEDINQAKKDLMKHADNLSMYRLELQNENTTYQRRIQLRRLIAAEERAVEEKKDTIRTESRRLAETQLGEMDKELKEQQQSVLAASMEVQRATELKNQAWLKTIWTKAIHGEGSKEHDAAVSEYNDRVLAVSDAKKNLEDNKTQMATMRTERSNLRTELDKEHRTAMGNVRLFFKGETDWQQNLKDGWTNMKSTIKTWFKDNIYDPGSSGGVPGTDTPLRIFGIEMKWPKLSFPSWQEIKASLPWWLGGGGAEGGVTKVFTDHFKEWSWELPKWSDVKAKLPNWLGGSLEVAGSALKGAGETVAAVAGIFGDAFSEWKLDVPSWEETQKTLPKWLGGTGDIGQTVDLAFATFKNWEFKLPAWADIKKELPWWLGGGTDETKTTLQAFKDEFGAGWTFNIPTWASIKSFIPTWLGGTKGESPEEQAKLEFEKWTFKFPTWAEISAFLPDWIKDPVGWIKGIFKKGDETASVEEQARDLKKGASKRQEESKDLGVELIEVQRALTQQQNLRGEKDRIGNLARENWLKTDMGKEFTGLQGLQENNPDLFTEQHQKRLKFLTSKQETIQNIHPLSQISPQEVKLEQNKEAIQQRLVELNKTAAEDQRLMTTDIATLVKEATAPSESLRVHDVHMERLLAPVPVQLGALLGSLGALNSGGSTTINNITNAPSTVNQSSSSTITENSYGVADPYTSAAGAYG